MGVSPGRVEVRAETVRREKAVDTLDHLTLWLLVAGGVLTAMAYLLIGG